MSTVSNKPSRHPMRQTAVFVALLIFLVGSMGYLAWETRFQWDVSDNGRNSLSEASLEVMRKLDGPLTATIYASPQDAHMGNISGLISEFLAPYQRVKPDFNVTFIDPAEYPALADEAKVQTNGETIIEFSGRSERLTVFNEQALINLLMRLARSSEKKVMVLSGHGEPRVDGIAGRDLGEFGKQLAAHGFKLQVLNLGVAKDVPADTSVLVISSPQFDLQEGELDTILAYIAGGGSLLWLLDQKPMHGLQRLAEKLELTLTPGVVVDPQAQQLNSPITFTVGANYGQHAVTHNFDYITVFPFARQITINDNDEWQAVSLIEAAQSGWVETGSLDSGPVFDPAYDVSGPVSIAAALSRIVQDREQRIAVIGGGYFLANTYLGYGKNLDFGINLINWLSGDEELIAIQPRATLDRSLTLSESALMIIAWGFLIVMPLIFLLTGTMIWWTRRRQ